ncbi:putative transcription factor c2h2 protein [Botrytis fragariae]|uniref:Putative transcription factor c2h2 protein n=1 Tax=Botrytis fragariae TaxID=1964551 RepID=A0A8H6AKT5_9HELO|nr:putative transcription factor c2h2 protein [Botrytis fragariae]KAF5869229.1 putative transcription factor c2h2 protein [Botrytis fragariae]
MSFRTVEEAVAAYESAPPQQGCRDPGSNLARPPICGDQVSHSFDNDLNKANHLSYNNFDDNNLDDFILFPNGELTSYDLEFDDDLFAYQDGVEQLASISTAGSSDNQSPLQCQITPQRLGSEVRDRSYDFPGQVEYTPSEMPEPVQTSMNSQHVQTLSKAGTISGSDLENHDLEIHESNLEGPTKVHRQILPLRRSTRNKGSCSTGGTGNIVSPHQTTNDLESMVQCYSQRLADYPASRSSSISAGVEFTSKNFRSKLFDRVCETTSEFEDEPLNRSFVASEIRKSIQDIYRDFGFKGETTKTESLVGESILEIIRDKDIPWKDMKPMKIAESVYKIYFEAGNDQPIPQNISSRRHNTRAAFSDSTPRTNRNPSVFSRSSKRPSDYEGSTSIASSSSKRPKVSSDEYNCYYDDCNASVELKGIGPHNKIHNPYEFFACIVPGCLKIFPRKETMKSHLKTKSHKGYLKGLSKTEMNNISEKIRENTFIITDRTHDHCGFCDIDLLRGSWEDCRRSHAHIMSHQKSFPLLPFRHSCSDKDKCGTKDHWKTSTCIQPKNRKRVPYSDYDDSDCEVRSEIDEDNLDCSNNGNSTEPQERPVMNLYAQGPRAQDYRGSNDSFSGGSYPRNRSPSEYRSPYQNKQSSRLRPMLDTLASPSDTELDIAMSRFRAEDPDSEHRNNYTIRDPSHETLRLGMLKSSVDSYITIAEQEDDDTTTQPSMT